MLVRWVRAVVVRPWLRIPIAVALLMVGLAPVGIPIMSDTSWKSVRPAVESPASSQPSAKPFQYQADAEPNGNTFVQRSDDGGATWHAVAAIPQAVTQLEPVRGDERLVYARSSDSVWVSSDGGASWARAASLASRPLSMAVSSGAGGPVFVGTESLGLLRSNDGGASWQAEYSAALSKGTGLPLAVTALSINPDDEQVLYAATAIWLGTSTVHLTPLGIYISLDGGREWLPMQAADLRVPATKGLEPVRGRPMAVVAIRDTGRDLVELKSDPELRSFLGSAKASVRASAARAIGLIGDRNAVPMLMQGLEDADPVAGQRAAEAIGRIGDVSAVPGLIQMVGSGADDVRGRAALALGMLKAEQAVPALASLLRSAGPGNKRAAAEALAAIGTPGAIGALMEPLYTEALSDGDMTPARHAAMIGLESAGKAAVAPLAAGLEASDADVRAHAAEVLGWIGSAEATQALAKALSDPVPAVRSQAAWALGEVGRHRRARHWPRHSPQRRIPQPAQLCWRRSNGRTWRFAKVNPPISLGAAHSCRLWRTRLPLAGLSWDS